jgi:hypothetical protein
VCLKRVGDQDLVGALESFSLIGADGSSAGAMSLNFRGFLVIVVFSSGGLGCGLLGLLAWGLSCFLSGAVG